MITINFKCNTCGNDKGNIEMFCDEPFIVCDKEECGEAEPIKDFDILGND